jgi:hypothetical protein
MACRTSRPLHQFSCMSPSCKRASTSGVALAAWSTSASLSAGDCGLSVRRSPAVAPLQFFILIAYCNKVVKPGEGAGTDSAPVESGGAT